MSEYKTRDAVAAKLREICVDLYLGQSANEVRDESRLVKDLGADSLDMVELAMAIEETFGFDAIPDAEIDTCDTFGQLVDLVCGKLGIGAQ